MTFKKLSLTFFICFMSLSMLSFVSSWGPFTHTHLSNEMEINGFENDIIRMCFDNGINEKSFRSGSMLSDITVTKYFSEGERLFAHA